MKDEANLMVEDLRAAFKELVTETQWMDSQTQVKYFFQKGFFIITEIETNYHLRHFKIAVALGKII